MDLAIASDLTRGTFSISLTNPEGEGTTLNSLNRILDSKDEAEMYAITKEELDGLMNMDGRVRGVVLHTDAEYVRRHEGEETLCRVEEETKKMGYPIDYSKIKMMAWYPVALRGVSLFAIARTLNFSDEQLREMGRAAPKYSIITKLMLRYLVSLEMLMKRLDIYWHKNYSTGSLKGQVTDRALFIYLKNAGIPAPLFPYLEGYFLGVLGMLIGNHERVKVERREWLDEDSECCELMFKW